MGLSTRRIRRGRRVAVSGVVAPATTPRVDVLLERKVRGRYRRVRRRRLPVRDGALPAHPAARRARGLYRVTVSVDGASTRQYLRVI